MRAGLAEFDEMQMQGGGMLGEEVLDGWGLGVRWNPPSGLRREALDLELFLAQLNQSTNEFNKNMLESSIGTNTNCKPCPYAKE